MTPEQKAKRLAMIKTIAEKHKRKKAFLTKMNSKSAAVEGNVKARKIVRKGLTIAGVKDDYTNINQWTDASDYADKYYGETFRQTTRFDNDWD
jgi:hypothetical protein